MCVRRCFCVHLVLKKCTFGFGDYTIFIIFLPLHLHNSLTKNHTTMGIIISLLLGALAGFLAGKIMRGGGFGLLLNIIIGVVGGFIGGFIMNLLGVNAGGGMVIQLLVAVLGAVVLLWVISLFKKK